MATSPPAASPGATPSTSAPTPKPPTAAPSPSASVSNAASSPSDAKPAERQASNPPLAKRLKTEHAPASPTVAAAAAAQGSTQAGTISQPAAAAANGQSASRAQPEPQAQTQTDGRDNFDSLVDVMGFSGVNLRAEEEAIQQRDLMEHSQLAAGEAEQGQDDDLYLQVYPLAFKVHTIAQKHGLSVDAQVLNYLSIAARTRFRNLLETMVASSRHRSWSSHHHPPPRFEEDGKTPMYHEVLLSDPRKQLAALERADRGDEAHRRKERLARDEQAAAAASGLTTEGGDGEGGEAGGDGARADGKKKPKKIGPGVAARTMSEDVQKRLANSTAMRNLGGGASSKYSWLSGGSSFGSGMMSPLSGTNKVKTEAGGDKDGGGTPSRLPKPKFAPQPSFGGLKSASQDGPGDEASGTGTGKSRASGAWGDVSARQAAKEEKEKKERLKVTLRDALFALEYERSGGAGHGSGEAILYRVRAKGLSQPS